MPRADSVIRHFATTCSLVRGFGELVDGLSMDDEKRQVIYATCSDLGLPIIFYGSSYSSFDDVGLLAIASAYEEIRSAEMRPWPEPPAA